MKEYNHKAIEEKWRTVWKDSDLYQVDDVLPAGQEKFYCLDMFPNISGSHLHVGHFLGYTLSDVESRFALLQGKRVLHPMGWDAFGLPVENFAIKNNIHPKKAKDKNKKTMKGQLEMLAPMYDWDREIDTSDPKYYKWTQWFFLQLYRAGLAYRKEAPVNWCPKDLTVLANEQVVDGCCERCNTPVERRNLKQWFFKITAYADRLESDLAKIDWPERTKKMQQDWIGRSEGVEVGFAVGGSKEKIIVFTTRLDTIFGATYLVLAPEHPLVAQITSAEQREAIETYVKQSQRKSELERISDDKKKTGVFTGAYAINPANNEKIPIWVADYVLMTYGTGAIMAVPGHDERDGAFATAFELSIREVVLPHCVDSKNPPRAGKKTVERQAVHGLVYDPKTKKYLCVQWKEFPWIGFVIGGVEPSDKDVVEAARREILEETGYKNLKLIRVMGGQVVSEYYAAHKDENRKAYATPVYFELENDERVEVAKEERAKHEAIWLNRSELTPERMTCAELGLWLERLDSEDALYTEDGVLVNSAAYNGLESDDARKKITADLAKKGLAEEKVNYKMRDWLFSRQRYWGAPIPMIYCADCGEVPVDEKELPVLLPEVADFKPRDTGRSPLANVSEFVNVKCPKCGGSAERETDTMDGFVCSSWYFLRFPSPHDDAQAFDPAAVKSWMPVDLYVGGAEHSVGHLIYARFFTKFLFDQGLVGFEEPFKKLYHQGIIYRNGAKMSKSKGNVVNPDEIVDVFGADSLRTYELFMGPADQAIEWSDRGIEGVYRFLSRAYRMVVENVSGERASVGEIADVSREINTAINRVTRDIGSFHFNTAISAMMVFVNGAKDKKIPRETLEKFVILLAPFAPHIAEEMWQELGHKQSVFKEGRWPAADLSALKKTEVTIAVQVNGKLRGTVVVPVGTSEDEVVAHARKLPNVAKNLEGKTVKKVVFVKDKILGFVI